MRQTWRTVRRAKITPVVARYAFTTTPPLSKV
jgi:hypothetical protein